MIQNESNIDIKNYNKEEEFFIIDSNNLETIQTKLYGYCIQNDRILKGGG